MIYRKVVSTLLSNEAYRLFVSGTLFPKRKWNQRSSATATPFRDHDANTKVKDLKQHQQLNQKMTS